MGRRLDDLWKLGKPTGKGGPWKNSSIKAWEPSDPYLFGFYDHRKLTLSHDSKEAVRFAIQFQPLVNGPWMTWKEVDIAPGEIFEDEFSKGFQARWIRFQVNKDCKATAWLEYW
jgi:hypothetical protein